MLLNETFAASSWGCDWRNATELSACWYENVTPAANDGAVCVDYNGNYISRGGGYCYQRSPGGMV